jgi:hypothetical protein
MRGEKMKRGIILATCVALGLAFSSQLYAQSIIHNAEYRYMNETINRRIPQSAEDTEALKAFREFRYSLIKSLRKHRSHQKANQLEKHWKDVKPY